MGLRGEHCRSLSVRRIQGRQSNSFSILLPPFSGATRREGTNPSPYAVPTQHRKQFPPWYLSARRPRLLSPILHLKRYHGSGTRNFCANPLSHVSTLTPRRGRQFYASRPLSDPSSYRAGVVLPFRLHSTAGNP